MTKNFKKLLIIPLFGLMFAGNASAVVVENGNTLEGINGVIDVHEQSLFGSFSEGVQYAVDVNPQADLGIYIFGVSTNDIFEFVVTDRIGWSGEQLTAAAWDEEFGSFEALFGDDLYVNVYFVLTDAEVEGVPISSSTGFDFRADNSGVPASDFVALDLNRDIIDQSRRAAPNDVPEPGPLALLGLGLIGIGLMRRGRKS